jgi:hypothetical protein
VQKLTKKICRLWKEEIPFALTGKGKWGGGRGNYLTALQFPRHHMFIPSVGFSEIPCILRF